MKALITLLSLSLIACGQGGSKASTSAAYQSEPLKHALLILDPQVSTLASVAQIAGYDITVKYATGWVTTTPGIHDSVTLDGAIDHLQAWLGEQDYDAVLFAMGQTEWLEGYNADQSAHIPPNNQNAHMASFLTALRNQAPLAKLVYVPMGSLPDSAGYGLQSQLGLIITNTKTADWAGVALAVSQSLN